jgi:FMN reductase
VSAATSLRVTAVSAGESPQSRTRALAGACVAWSGSGALIDLSTLPGDGLLGRVHDDAVAAAVAAASAADVLVLATPVYRATYSGALKAFLDRFDQAALAGTAVVLAATAASPHHFLALDTGGRALVASLGGWTVPSVVYATPEDFADGAPTPSLRRRVDHAMSDAFRLAYALPSVSRVVAAPVSV